MVDVRFLPNPHFDADLRPKTGQDEDVRQHVYSNGDAEEFITRYHDLLEFLIPRYKAEGKRYLNVAVGCTGGRHRSVAISEALSKLLEKSHASVSVRHRDIKRANRS